MLLGEGVDASFWRTYHCPACEEMMKSEDCDDEFFSGWALDMMDMCRGDANGDFKGETPEEFNAWFANCPKPKNPLSLPR